MAPFVPKTSVGEAGILAELKRLAAYINPRLNPLGNIAVIATANATDLATSQALANANKVKINAIITAFQGVRVATGVALITTPDATNLATVQTLSNDTKAKVNELLGVLTAAGLMS